MKTIKISILALAAFSTFGAAAQDKVIATSELPKSATAFLDKHFKANAISHAAIDQDLTGKSYEVKLGDGTEVEFDAKGEWKEIDGQNKAIPAGLIPTAVNDYVSKQYPKDKITQISRNSRQIEVELTSGLELDFDAAGKFVRIDK